MDTMTRPGPRPDRHLPRGHGFHDRPAVTVNCSCGRTMHQQADQSPDAYRCGCGRTVSVAVGVQRTDRSNQACGVLRAGGISCGAKVRNSVATIGGVCDGCLRSLLSHVAVHPDWRDHLVQLLGDAEVSQIRADAENEARRAAAAAAATRAASRAAERDDTAIHVVYYVRTGDRTIKIGTTGHLTERMRSFRVANPDNLLAAEPGSYDLEHERHQQFRAWRYHRRREDFGDSTDLLQHIATVRAEHGDPWAVGGAR